MLAIIPSGHAASLSTGSSAMSLALLPTAASHMAYNPQSGLFVSAPSPSKRPKLSLNTNNVPPVFGNSSTSLRIDTLSATSPTARNTFRNTLKPNQPNQRTPHPRAPLPALTPLITNVVASSERVWSASPIERKISSDFPAAPRPTTPLISPVSKPSRSDSAPYQIAQNVSSILTNGPFARKRTRTNCLIPDPAAMTSATKSVVFRTPLTEEIQTTKYVMRHSDLESSVSTISTLDLTNVADDGKAAQTPSSHQADLTEAQSLQANTPAAPVQSEVKDVSQQSTSTLTLQQNISTSEENDEELGSATPLAGRRKRHRQWVWTLGPVASQQTQTSLSSSPSTSQAPSTHEASQAV